MGSDREQESTTTDAAVASGQAGGPVGAVGAMLGRYRLEHVLGAGAIGVVHAAFDPDLERRIALKVLQVVAPTPEAKDRLLREARAMARLAHPNVVTVYEVGTANGRDFVAMELIRGEPLVDWLRSSRRTPDAIIDAFLAAGRGLAAAHAAGIVHRDFKPHNVLRSREGRIAVTDFGLAREADAGLPVGLDTTLPLTAPSNATRTPSEPASLTSTGAVLGTPGYMAPEQWCGGTVTPATDQFAYCVALWEALAGERPYRGRGTEELQHQVVRGPAGLDASKLPRRVRGLLRRGLDPDPSRRWPSMDALLLQLGRAGRGSRVAVASAGAAVVAAIVLVVATRAGGAPAAACTPPARDVTAVWSPVLAAEVRTRISGAHAAVLDAAHRDWQAARASACTAPPTVRQAQLSCLDGVLERFDAVRLAYLRVPAAVAEELQAPLIDPTICSKPAVTEVPRLALVATPSVVAAYELYAQSGTDHKPGDAEIAALIGKPSTDACARVIATLAFEAASTDVPQKRSVMADARAADDQCGDERVHADLMIQDIPYHLELPMFGPRGQAAITQAEAAVARVMQPDLAAALAQYRAVLAHQRARWDEAFREVEDELAGYRARGLQGGQLYAVIMRNYLRLGRAEPADLEAIAGDVQAWRSVALANHETESTGQLDVRPWRPLALANHKAEIVRQLDALAAMARFRLGDVSARDDLIRVWQAQPRAARAGGSRTIAGQVVDTVGRPVAGALVAAGTTLSADSVGLGLPVLVAYNDFRDPDLRTTTSDAAGRFWIEDAAPDGVIAAQLGDRRSDPRAIADRVRLVLQPTRSLRGKVDLGPVSHTRVTVTCTAVGDLTGRLTLIAPVAPDGSFAIAGAPVTALRIGVSIQRSREYDQHIASQILPAATAATTGLHFGSPSSTRTVDVIVRSTVTAPLDGARVSLIAGHHSIESVADTFRLRAVDLRISPATPAVGQQVPASVVDRIRPGDLVAHIEQAALGDLTVCASSFVGDPLDPASVARGVARFAQLAIRCEQVGPDATVVELVVPPQPRVD